MGRGSGEWGKYTGTWGQERQVMQKQNMGTAH